MSEGKKTRQGILTHMRTFIGSGKPLMVSELPTLRDVLRYGLFLREQKFESIRSYTVIKLAQDVYPTVIHCWRNVNPLFVPPILNTRSTILKKIQKNWHLATKLSHPTQGKSSEREVFIQSLDRLFDILSCQCNIFGCIEFKCVATACQYGVHAVCSCLKATKIPNEELQYVKSQREKVGTFSTLQLFSSCKPGTSRENFVKVVEPSEKKRDQHLEIGSQNNAGANESQSDIGTSTSTVSLLESCSTSTSKETAAYNTLDISNVALQSLRYNVSLRATAAITTAALCDAGLITNEDKRLVVDHKKVFRGQTKIMQAIDKEIDELMRSGQVQCIFFDGREDVTKVLLEADNTNQKFPGCIKEQHYTICCEPGEKFHFK